MVQPTRHPCEYVLSFFHVHVYPHHIETSFFLRGSGNEDGFSMVFQALERRRLFKHLLDFSVLTFTSYPSQGGASMILAWSISSMEFLLEALFSWRISIVVSRA